MKIANKQFDVNEYNGIDAAGEAEDYLNRLTQEEVALEREKSAFNKAGCARSNSNHDIR